MGKRRKGRKKPWQTEKPEKPIFEVKIVGPSSRELVERIRTVLEDELWLKEKRYQEAPNQGLAWKIERFENALFALEELERRATK